MTIPFPRLCSSVALAILLTWLLAWRPLSWPGPIKVCRFEWTVATAVPAEAAIRVDEGHGYDDGKPLYALEIPAGTALQKIAMTLPPQRVRAIKIDVSSTPALVMSGARLTCDGEILADFTTQVFPGASTRATIAGGAVALRSASGGSALSCEYRPVKAVILPAGDEPLAVEVVSYFVLLTALLAAGQAAAARRGWPALGGRARAAAARVSIAAREHPALLLTGVGILASAASCYPVVFCGKSFVSANAYPSLLYLRPPTIPGLAPEPSIDPHGSDIAATMLYHLPISAVEHDALFRDHELPLWNRYGGGGVSLLGQGQSMFGDPLHWLPILANGAWWAWDLKFLIAKALFSCGIGLCVWIVTRRVGIAALVGGSAAWIGFFAYRMNHPAFFSLCYAPWVLLPWLGAPGARSRRAVLLVAVGIIAGNWCELTSGTAKEAAMILLSLNAVGFSVAAFVPDGWARRRKALFPPLAAFVVFLLVSAPHWLVFIDVLRQAATLYDTPAAYQLQPGLIIGFFEDIFSQDFAPVEAHAHLSANMLALAGLLWLAAAWRSARRDRTVLALAVGGGAVAAVVFGVIPPAWIERTPLLGGVYHIHDTFGCALIVITLILGGTGLRDCLEQAAAPEWKEIYSRWLFGVALLLALYLGFTQALPQPPYTFFWLAPPWHSRFFVQYVPALLAALLALPLALRWTQAPGERRAAGMIITGVCLVFLLFRDGMYVRTRFDGYVLTPRGGGDLAAKSRALEEVQRRLDEPYRVGGFDPTFSPGYNTLMRLEAVCGPDALFNRYYRELTDAAKAPRYPDWRILIREADFPGIKPLFDALNLRYYFREAPGHPAPAGLASIGAADLEVFESKEAWPRAFFTDHVRRYETPQELVAMVKNGDGRPFAAVQGAPAVSGEASYAPRRVVAAKDYRLTTNVTEFTVKASGPGVIVLTENFEEGNFRVTVNGAAAPWFRVNHAFKGVSVPAAGVYRVRFEYWPRVLTAALWLCASGVLLGVVGIVWCGRKGAQGKG